MLYLPSTFNGIGDMYYGKKNKHSYNGTCEFCNRDAELKSYDTTNYFVLLFVPVFPLGERRVINECSICRKHRVLKLSEWEKLKKEAAEESYNSWIQEPNNVEKTKELFSSIFSFRNIELLNSIDQNIRNNHMSNPEILALLGEIHLFFNQFDEAERAFEDSLSIETDTEVKEILAETLAKNLKPDKAKTLLTHIFDEKQDSKLYYVRLVIESYQFIGEHDSALEMLDYIEEVFPEVKNDKMFKKHRKRSKRHLNNAKSIKGKTIPVEKNKHEDLSFSFIFPKIIPPLLIVSIILIYMLVAVLKGSSQDVHVVNGLDIPYDIEINGERIFLPAKSTKRIDVPEGTTKVSIVESDIVQGEFEFSINNPFWKRPFIKKIYILNPDKVAIFLWEETIYSTSEYQDPYYINPYKVYVGDYFYEFDRVDFLFKDFPESLEISSSKVTRTRIEQVKNVNSIMEYMYILEDVDFENVLSHVHSKFMYNPDDEMSLQLLIYTQDEEDVINLLRSKLEERPILVNLHTYYQNYMRIIYDPSYDLKGEYLAYLENEKDNNDLYYLLSRIEGDFEEAGRLLKKSIEGDTASAYGYYGFAYRNLTMGNFEEAYDHIIKAIELGANQEKVFDMKEDIMLSLKMYDNLLEENKLLQKGQPYNGDLVSNEILLHMSKGDVDGAEDAVLNYLDRIKDTSDSNTVQIWEKYLNGLIAYYLGDVETYADSIEDIAEGDAELAFEDAFIKGDYEKAADIAVNNFESSYLVLLYLAEDNAEKANEYLTSAIELYQQHDEDGIKVAEYLSGAKFLTLEDVNLLDVLPSEKVLILLAIEKQQSDYQSDYREEILEIVRKLNYKITFPNHFIKSLIE